MIVAVLASAVSFAVVILFDAHGESEGLLLPLWRLTVLPTTACVGVASTFVYDMAAAFGTRRSFRVGVLLANSALVAAIPWAALLVMNAVSSL